MKTKEEAISPDISQANDSYYRALVKDQVKHKFNAEDLKGLIEGVTPKLIDENAPLEKSNIDSNFKMASKIRQIPRRGEENYSFAYACQAKLTFDDERSAELFKTVHTNLTEKGSSQGYEIIQSSGKEVILKTKKPIHVTSNSRSQNIERVAEMAQERADASFRSEIFNKTVGNALESGMFQKADLLGGNKPKISTLEDFKKAEGVYSRRRLNAENNGTKLGECPSAFYMGIMRETSSKLSSGDIQGVSAQLEDSYSGSGLVDRPEGEKLKDFFDKTYDTSTGFDKVKVSEGMKVAINNKSKVSSSNLLDTSIDASIGVKENINERNLDSPSNKRTEGLRQS